MRQKENSSFISLLNKVRIAEVNQTAKSLFRSRFVNNYTSYLAFCVHKSVEYKSVGEHDRERLNEIHRSLVCR